MIVCSCNVFSDSEVRVALAGQRLRMSRIYASLGCAAKCGSCARTIKNIIAETEGPALIRRSGQYSRWPAIFAIPSPAHAVASD
jgi:bacterioferritin-associated ferredoxin